VTDKGGLAGPEVPDPGGQVDDLVGHLGGVGLLADLVAEPAERVEGGLPVLGRNAVGDGRDDVRPVARLL
jgi:hypothetical protein